MKQIGHPFEGDIDTTDQGNLLDPSLCMDDHAPADYMGGDHPNHHNKEQKQDRAESGSLDLADMPGEIMNQFMKTVE